MAEFGESGTLPVIDCDVHPMIKSPDDVLGYLPANWQRHFEVRGMRLYGRARDRYNHPNKTYRTDAVPAGGGPAGSDRDYTLAQHVGPHEIASALLLPQEPYGVMAWGDPAAAAAFCRAINDLICENWVAYDDRFTLALTVSAHDPHAAAKEIRRLGGTPGVVGVQLLILEQMLGSTWFDPIYEAACENRLPIVFHQSGVEGCYTSAQTVAGGVPRSYGERHVVLTQVGAANLVDLLVSGAFERFPELRVVMVEWGFSWLASLLTRLDHMWDSDPVAAPLIRKRPSEYVSRHVTFTTQPFDEPNTAVELSSIFAIPGIDRMLLFSSDYPHYDTDAPDFMIKRIPGDVRSRVCYENAVETFGDKIIRTAR